ncbi:DUF2785 domain-containing protein [Mumia sp.]|uniref:DUF2785 domain-containing protein n=1 Tax=Mumia sp. TaxID=1965300 RepID=UPI00263186C1|nr:DUF2785 domain-containing protein [Mumia sp.]MDD9350180.1 DUF2785 domain-containing protein [Mumia sp.]
MSESYWRSVIDAGMHVPDDRSLNDLTLELIDMLASPDAHTRDAIAFPLLATWIHSGEYDALLRGFGNGVVTGLQTGLGTQGDLTILRRSYTALVLSEIIVRDNEMQLLPAATVMGWGDQATSWFVREKDLRGWIPDVGWANAGSHGADLLGALARSPHFDKLELTVLLDVLADRLLSPTEHVLHHGEEDRLAYAAMAVLHRDVVAPNVVEPWLARLGAGTRRPRTRGSSPGEWPTPAAYNTSRFLRALYVQLALGVKGRVEVVGDDALFATPTPHRADLLLAVIEQIRAETPWLFATAGGRRTVTTAR